MATRIDVLDVALPELHAVRLLSDEPHVGVKEYYAVARVEAGQSEWWSRGKLWQSHPGSLQLQGPGDVHRDITRVGPMTYTIINFAIDAVENAIGDKLEFLPQLDAADERGAPFQRLHAAVRRGAERFALEVAMAEAIAGLAAISGGRSERSRPVRRALDLLRERLAEPITLDELAAHAGLDKYRLCRAFRSQLGMPPHTYLTHLRVIRAKQLLDRGTRPIDVAPLVGLYDQSQLNRHFRKLVGTTPGRYATTNQRRVHSVQAEL